MKRFVLFLIVICLALSATACSGNASDADVNRVLDGFVGALKAYDRTAMELYLTEFPDNTGATYPDDIFNNSSYVELYRSLYSDITYAVTSYEKNNVTVKITMPDIEGLYKDTCEYVRKLADRNAELDKKLKDNDVIFIQEMMRDRAAETIEMMEVEYVLEVIEDETSILIVCDDELRSMITGNFYRAKSEIKDGE